jgi:competence protein ComEC
MIAEHKGEIPVFVLILPFCAGIGLGINLLSGTNINWLTGIFIALCFVFILLNLTYTRLGFYKAQWIGGALITFLLFLAGWISVIRYNELNNTNHFSKVPAQYLVVKINNEPSFKYGMLRFTADVMASANRGEKQAVSGTLLITLKDPNAKNFYYGDELLIPAKYDLVEPPLVPAEFNYKKYLANQNIYYQAFIQPQQYLFLNTDQGNQVVARSLRLRRRLIAKLKTNMHNTDAVAVASTLILGYKADLSNDVLQAYSKTGTIHVLSVSGEHVGILYVLLMLTLSFLNRFRYGRAIRAVIITAVVCYYALLSGFSPAVCRAAVMISMIVIGKAFSRYLNTLNILAVSAFALLLYNPLYIADVGFQLSYLAVGGLIIFQPIVYKWLTFKRKWADKLWALCSVSIAAQVITFPLSAFYFHQFPVYFLISNLFIVVPTMIIMWAGFVYLFIPLMPGVSKALAFVLEQTIILMNKGLAIIEHAPFASINKIWLTTPEYLLLYVIIISVFYFLYDKKIWLLKLSLICTLVLCISLSVKKINQLRTNSIAWLNLKKHKGIVFKNGYEAVVLTDLPETDKAWAYSVQPYLDSCQVTNIKRIDLNADVSLPWLAKKHGLIYFTDKKILILNGKIKNNIFSPKLKTNYIYLTGNPDMQLNEINSNFDYQLLVADGSNSDELLNAIAADTKGKQTNFKILKRNISLITISN